MVFVLGDLSPFRGQQVLIVTATCDPLRDEGRQLAQKMSELGVQVTAMEGPGSHCIPHLINVTFKEQLFEAFGRLMLPQTWCTVRKAFLAVFLTSLAGEIDWFKQKMEENSDKNDGHLQCGRKPFSLRSQSACNLNAMVWIDLVDMFCDGLTQSHL